jgi:hypothetical protein
MQSVSCGRQQTWFSGINLIYFNAYKEEKVFIVRNAEKRGKIPSNITKRQLVNWWQPLFTHS